MIRDYALEDKEGLLELVKDFYNSPAVSHPIPLENFSHCFDEIMKGNPFLRGLTILHAGEILGYCQLSFTYSSEADGMVVLIEELYVKPAFRSLGVAKQVFDLIFSEYEGKAKRYRLECSKYNPRAMKLYRELGFEELDYVQMIIDK
ncbi:MAG: GNAT family N-acetyltransferase [Oscillospiraceae bacterium]|nr:GNAT family N-acetyltransferase [Oscillospiraceae bacterium]